MQTLRDLGHRPHTLRAIREMMTFSCGLNLLCGGPGATPAPTLKAIATDISDRMRAINIVTKRSSPREPELPSIAGIAESMHSTLGGIRIWPYGLTGAVTGPGSLTHAIRGVCRTGAIVIAIDDVTRRKLMEVARKFALTGHQVWATVRRSKLPHNFEQFRDDVVTGVLRQERLTALCPHCKQTADPDAVANSDPTFARIRELDPAFQPRYCTLNPSPPKACGRNCAGGLRRRGVLVSHSSWPLDDCSSGKPPQPTLRSDALATVLTGLVHPGDFLDAYVPDPDGDPCTDPEILDAVAIAREALDDGDNPPASA